MSEPLRWMLTGLVLLNLAFVQLTATVSAPSMALLWSFALATPWLARWHERTWYRGLWNAGVLSAFTFLVQDALTSGLLHMLEDGLSLSALCQVHLLNNLGRKQRPDLLFFNSFLIAFVTSFFCGDLAWSITFLGYAALLVPALQVHAASHTNAAPHADLLREALRSGFRRSCAALLATAVVFAAWPRDFQRQGFLGDTLALAGQPVVAFAEQVRLDRTTTPTLSDAPVLRIDGASSREDVPSHWRGASFVHFDGAGWVPYRARDFGTRNATDPGWRAQGADRWTRGNDDARTGTQFEVRLLDRSARRIFLPLEAREFEVLDRASVLVDPKADGTVGVLEFETEQPLRWSVRTDARVGAVQSLTRGARAILTQLPPQLPQPIRAIAQEVLGSLPKDADPALRAERAREWLSSERRYALPGEANAARSLDDFLLGTGGGHCEYFATALALLLRQDGIPCRVVGGYLAQEWDESQQCAIVRQRHAHAWVEAFLPGRGWTTLDATPAMADAGETGPPSWWDRTWDALAKSWDEVAGFDAEDRKALIEKALAWPGRLWGWIVAHPVEASGLVLLLAFAIRRRIRRRLLAVPQSVRELRAAMKELAVVAAAGETPRELLARVRSQHADPERTERLAAAVAAHEAERYARPTPPPDL